MLLIISKIDIRNKIGDLKKIMMKNNKKKLFYRD